MNRLSGPPVITPSAAAQAPLPGGQLLSKLGHELRSPLTGIVGLARILLRDAELARPADRATHIRQLTLVQASAERMLGMIEQVVVIAKLQSAEVRPDLSSLDCRVAVRETARSLQPVADMRGMRLRTDVPDDPVIVAGDGPLLARLLHELLDNAVKYADPGEVCLRVLAERDSVVVEVRDGGPGIPVAEQARVLEAFERGEDAADRDEGGAGLGLYLAQEIARQLDADLWLSSAPGRGTTATVRLARRTDQQRNVPAAQGGEA